MQRKVIVAMSGGVDSAVAAYRLIGQGYTVSGATLTLFDAESDLSAGARDICRRLGIEHVVIDARETFARHVIDPFVQSYLGGQTPNPCIFCNRHIKFGLLYEYARSQGAGFLATGHYARMEYDGGAYILRKARDSRKDQSYVLYALTQEQMAHVLFPLGDLTKEETRLMAAREGLLPPSTKESQDICFLPDGQYARFLETYTGVPHEPGDFVDEQGRILGRHKGQARYTVGQRKGLGLSAPEPLYVCGKDARANRVILAPEGRLFSRHLEADALCWIADKAPGGDFTAAVKIRYSHKEQPARILLLGEDRMRVTFDKPQRAATPGQAVVLYDGDAVLGGGTICAMI